jgi:AbiEi antitoxin C-terminal domain
MDVHLKELAARQRDLVAAWQLRAVGWTRKRIERHAAQHAWQRIHAGVYALSYSPLSREQLRMAATLTAPGTFLSHASAAAHYGIRDFAGRFETVTRAGTRGRHQCDGLLISYSKVLDTTVHVGIPITTPERTLIDLAAHADPARPLREARRLKLTTPYSLSRALHKHRGRRGTNRLKQLNDLYAGIPYSRCRSDAEARALEILHDASMDPHGVNEEIAGVEADLIYPGLIIEIDGPQFHQISAEDDRKQRIWEAARYTVRRISSDAIYQAPERLIRLVRLV